MQNHGPNKNLAIFNRGEPQWTHQAGGNRADRGFALRAGAPQGWGGGVPRPAMLAWRSWSVIGLLLCVCEPWGLGVLAARQG
jgi:hypothetical protein